MTEREIEEENRKIMREKKQKDDAAVQNEWFKEMEHKKKEHEIEEKFQKLEMEEKNTIEAANLVRKINEEKKQREKKFIIKNNMMKKYWDGDYMILDKFIQILKFYIQKLKAKYPTYLSKKMSSIY